MFSRYLTNHLKSILTEAYVHILFGARQTGKSTLLKALIPEAAIWLDLADPAQRSHYLAQPQNLIAECQALPPDSNAHVVIDEAQNVPALFDAVQYLYDQDKTRWRFVLCGSSARKLRATGANLLPGRALLHRLFPLTLAERAPPQQISQQHTLSPLVFTANLEQPFNQADLLERLIFGELPGIVIAKPTLKPKLLQTYSTVYLEEELRRAALIKDWSAFTRFLRLAAAESGKIINHANIAKQAGVSAPTIKNYYQLLEDMFIGFQLPAFSASSRKNVLSTPRFLLLDTGLRHAAAGLELSAATVLSNPGPIFAQWVGIELWKRLQYLENGQLSYLRTKSGMEIDFIIEQHGMLTPIKVQWTEYPDLQHAKHLLAFIDEKPQQTSKGFIICHCKRPMQLHEKIIALPWFYL